MLPPRRPSARELGLFAAACLTLAAAKLAIILLPFRAVVRSMHIRQGRGRGSGAEYVVAIKRAAVRVPWRTVCFDQALAAHWLLRFNGCPSILHYGIDSTPAGLSAHVWLTVQGQTVIGEAEAGTHARVASFPPETR